MSSFAPGSDASTPPDVNSLIAAVGQAAAADRAENAPEEPTGQTAGDDAGAPEQTHEPAPVAPPASSTMRQPEPPASPKPEPKAQQAGTVADFLGMDAGAVDRLVAALGAQQPLPAPGGPGAPAAAPAGTAATAQPAAGVQQAPDLRFVTDEQIDAQADIFGDEAVAVLKQMAASQREMHARYERELAGAREVVSHYRSAEQKQVEQTVGGFFGGMKDLGLDTKYGTGAMPATIEQAQARQQLGATADRIWQALGGKPDTLDQALKTAVYLTDRQAVEQSIASRARNGVRESLQKRKGLLDATPGGAGGPGAPAPNDPDKAVKQMTDGFVAAQRG